MSATPLEALIIERIRAHGPIGVAEFMALALGHPEHGYYMVRDPLGAGGDFVTAPEISPLFGELVGLWAAMVWAAMGRPDPVRLVELGPGRATLITDFWRAITAQTPTFAAALRLHLVETSPRLRDCQQQMLAPLAERCTWHRDLAEVPSGPLILIANEFFDALPIEQYERGTDGWHRRLVDLDPAGGGLCFSRAGPVPLDLAPDLAEAADGALIELCEAGEDLAGAIGRRLARDGGAALIIDYGPARSAPGESLQGVRDHRFAAVLAAPGTADLSHHVDFAGLARAARAHGAAVHGPLPQGLFLGRLGAGERAEALAAAAPERAEAILGAARRLLHPGRMGVLFKALAITDPRLPAPPGFAVARR